MPPAKKRTVSHKGARNKGRRGESEFVDVCRELGLPAQRVLASGSFVGAKADVKVGVFLNDDGTYPDADESRCVMRVEVKNRADNPEHLFTDTDDPFIIGLIAATREGPERLWDYLNQDKITKAIVLRRAKAPPGAIKRKDYNEMGMVCMGYESWIKLMLKAYGHELALPPVEKVVAAPTTPKERRFKRDDKPTGQPTVQRTRTSGANSPRKGS
jgi:hypothetical protein